MLTNLLAFFSDFRLGVRSLMKSPLFTAAAVLSLGMSIGANTAMFSVFNAVLWEPMPVDRPDNLVRLYSEVPGRPVLGPFSYPDVREYMSGGVADELAAYSFALLPLEQRDGEAVNVIGEAVGGNYFGMLKPPMQLGRGLRPEEAVGSGAPVAVISYDLWQRLFGGDPGVVGKVIRLRGVAFTVVGVAGRSFRGVYSNLLADEIWVPIPALATASDLENRRDRDYLLIGRLKPGRSVAETEAAARVVASRLAASYPDTNKGIRPYVFTDLETRPFIALAKRARVVAAVFLAIVSLVLLIACANVANLLLGRATTRRKEIATRLALGATRWQMIRQFLAESLALSLIAGGMGLLFGLAANRALGLLPLRQFGLPVVLEPRLGPNGIVFTLAISFAASLAFGLVPALRMSRADLVPVIKGMDAGAGSRRRRLDFSRTLVVAQLAMSLFLLVLSGLFMRSVGGVLKVNPGFRIDKRVVVQMSPSLAGYDQARSLVYYRGLLERLQSQPAVASVALARSIPLGVGVHVTEVAIEGRVARHGDDTVSTWSNVVDEHFFTAIGTPIVAGRAFTTYDKADAPGVVVVNETFARRYWPGSDPLGKRLQLDPPSGRWVQVVGVAVDGKYDALFEPATSMMYTPYAQAPRVDMQLVIEGQGDAAATIAAVRRELRAADPRVPVFSVKTMTQHMERQQVVPQLMASLIVPAGILAAVIAVIGLYAVMSYAVSRRTREIGIRVAIGAAPADILGLVLRQGLVVALLGLGLGLLASAGLTRMLSAFLFGISASDPLTFVGVPALLLVVAMVASYVPARRALAVDPVVSLKND